MPEYEEEGLEEEDLDLNPEEEIIDEEPDELPQPKKRRVVGIVRRNYSRQVPKEISPQRSPVDSQYIPEMYPQPQNIILSPPQRDQFQYRQTPEIQAKEQARLQILFNQEMEREQRRQARREYMRSRPSFGRHMIAVAHQAASGDRGAQRVNATLGEGLFRRPNVDLPTNKPIKKAVATRFNQIISKISPKISPMITSVNMKQKKKGKK
jgi:hypothetical protein